MSLLSSFHNPANVVLVGATGGIGGGFLQHLIADDNVGNIVACSRSPLGNADSKVIARTIDYSDEKTIEDAAKMASRFGDVDLVIVATGILHDVDLAPEKAIRELTPAMMQKNFVINTIGPALVAKHFLPLMRKDEKSVFAALSARVGSISDNGLGGWYSYRASKSALNMMLKSASIEHARRRPESVIIGLHPGTVDTALSKPYQGNVAEAKLFDAGHSTSQMLEVINSVGPKSSGKVFAYDGSEVPA